MANKTKFAGAALLGIGAIVVGCNRNNTSVQPVALAIEKSTQKPRPIPITGPTARPKTPGIALYKVKTRQKVFALTFDDGPDPTYTPQVLKILRQKHAPATFFMIGKMVRAHALTGQLVVRAGHPIGGHSWTHPKRTHNPASEIELTDAMIKEKLGITPTMFRPPYGMLKNGLAREASKHNEDVILWSSDSADYSKHSSAAHIKANVMRNLAPGGIALMHDGGGNRSKTVAALPGLIDGIRNRGYKLVTVPELLNMGAPEEAHIGGVTRARSARKHAAQAKARKP